MNSFTRQQFVKCCLLSDSEIPGVVWPQSLCSVRLALCYCILGSVPLVREWQKQQRLPQTEIFGERGPKCPESHQKKKIFHKEALLVSNIYPEYQMINIMLG